MKNLDDVFMDAFVKEAHAQLEALKEEPAELSDTDKLVAKIQEWRGERAEAETEKTAGPILRGIKETAGNMKEKARYQKKLFGMQSTKKKVAQGVGAAAAVGAAGYGIHKGIQAWKNRKNKK